MMLVSALVLSLLTPSGPSAVIGCVRSVGINTVQRESVRTTAHVVQKNREVVPPFITDDNTAATIKRVFGDARIVATAFHSSPRTVLSTDASGRRLAVCYLDGAYAIVAEASAAECFAANEIASKDVLFSAAIATTQPVNKATLPTRRHRRQGNNCQAAEALAEERSAWPYLIKSTLHDETSMYHVFYKL